MTLTYETAGHRDRDELVELMSRYANIPDTKNWDELPPTVLCQEFTADFSAFGTPAVTVPRAAWAEQSRQAFAGWTATHHAITNHLIAIDGDRATIRAHVHVEHWAPPEVAAGGPNCWLVAGFYDNIAVRTPQGWRLSLVKLTPTHQENEALLAASIAAAKRTNLGLFMRSADAEALARKPANDPPGHLTNPRNVPNRRQSSVPLCRS